MLATFAGGSLLDPGGHSSALWWCMPDMASGARVNGHEPSIAAAVIAGLPMWALMSFTMMVPAALPAVRHVAINSLRWRRRRAVGEFLAVYLGIWVAFGAIALGLLALLPSARTDTTVALVLALALAAAWQLTPQKRRALLACHRSSPLPPRGWRATAGVLRFAGRNGGACLGSCWAMMLVMAVLSFRPALLGAGPDWLDLRREARAQASARDAPHGRAAQCRSAWCGAFDPGHIAPATNNVGAAWRSVLPS